MRQLDLELADETARPAHAYVMLLAARVDPHRDPAVAAHFLPLLDDQG